MPIKVRMGYLKLFNMCSGRAIVVLLKLPHLDEFRNWLYYESRSTLLVENQSVLVATNGRATR